ncbi:MAG: YihY family inner membrane protein [Nitrosomonadales bacterium]|nr:YihY family inner membrane protein [Nitrosomonadales bacterium]
MQENWRNLLNFMRFIVMRFHQDRCIQIAASLTFTTLLSLVPLITIALTMFSAFPVFEDFSNQIKAYLVNNLMPNMAGKVITQYMQQFTESAMRLTAVGIVFLAVTAMLMMLTIDHAFNTIWRISRPRPLLKRLIVYWAVLTLTPLLIGASLSLTSWLVGLSMGYVKQIPIFGVGALKILPALFTTLAFTMLFELVPNRYVPRMHALIGAVAAAIVFESMNRVFGYYISHFPTYKLVYGAFASVPVFLMWIYLSWLTILVGAVIAASLSHWRAPAAQQLPPAAQLLDALRVLQIMVSGLQQGRVSTFPELSRSLHLGYDVLEKILEKLANADMVRKAEGQGWLLMRDAQHVQLAELYRLFVFDPSMLAAQDDDAEIHAWLGQIERRVADATAVTLHDLFTGTGSHGPNVS